MLKNRIYAFFESTPERLLFYHRQLMRLARLKHGIDRKKIIFTCFGGRSCCDNPRCIAERLNALRPDVKQIWLFTQTTMNDKAFLTTLPDYVHPLYCKSRAAYEALATARVWVDNFTKDNSIRPVYGRQVYIQTWHGDRAIKKICYDCETFEDFGYRLEERADLILTGSDFGQRMYRTAFRYKGEYLNMGAPRNDILVKNDPEQARRIREALGIDADTGVLLYAPTYREDEDVISMADKFDPAHTLDLLEQKTGRKWLLLFRAHYKSVGIDLKTLAGRMIDVSKYNEMSELLLISDMLITDYSSCAMDYILLDRPAFFYQADYAHYVSTRPCYYDPKDAPLLIAETREQLDALILNTDEAKARENCRAIREWYGYNETGRATEAVCDYIIGKLDS